MDAIIGIINLFANEYNIDISDIENTQGKVNEEMKPHGWVLVETGNKTCAALKWNEGMYENEGYLLNEERILNVFGNDEANRELELLETLLSQLECYLPKYSIINDNNDSLNIVNSGADSEESRLEYEIIGILSLTPPEKRERMFEAIFKMECYEKIAYRKNKLQERIFRNE